MDHEGYIQITDRLKDVIKTGGEWVSSLDLENAISLHGAVQEAAAVGIPDPKWGERPMMLVVLTPPFRGDGITPEVLKKHMKECADQGKIPRYAIPERYIITENIPKTSVGKTDKKVIRTLYASV